VFSILKICHLPQVGDGVMKYSISDVGTFADINTTLGLGLNAREIAMLGSTEGFNLQEVQS
jgi:hypothetical protein